ncbi:MAG: FAD-dependent oxidoreductase [Anaerolineales bacterium]|nr:FAD-dependent oxidoreductase [Anaerolineales bacterium]
MTQKTDVLIIGGGPIGLGCAYYLQKSGRQVALLDEYEIGKGSGAGNAGHVLASHIIPLAEPSALTSAFKWMFNSATSPFGMKVSLDPNYLIWLARFALACNQNNVNRAVEPLYQLGQLSAKEFSRMIAEEAFDCAYQKAGFLNLYKSQKAFDGGRHEADFLQTHGIATRVYSADEIQEVEPAAREDVLGGVCFPEDAHLDPALFLSALKGRVRQMGAELLDGVKVVGFEVADEKIVKVKTSAGDFEAEQIVLAAGARTATFARELKINIPLQPARGYSLTAAAIENMPRHALILGDRRVALTPLGDWLRVTGRLEIGQYDRTPNPLWIERLENFAREYLRFDGKLNVKETWAGLRPVAPDGLPIVGKSPKQKNLTLATGHGMIGLSLATGTGVVVSQLLNGQKTAFDLSPLRAERFQ